MKCTVIPAFMLSQCFSTSSWMAWGNSFNFYIHSATHLFFMYGIAFMRKSIKISFSLEKIFITFAWDLTWKIHWLLLILPKKQWTVELVKMHHSKLQESCHGIHMCSRVQAAGFVRVWLSKEYCSQKDDTEIQASGESYSHARMALYFPTMKNTGAKLSLQQRFVLRSTGKRATLSSTLACHLRLRRTHQ